MLGAIIGDIVGSRFEFNNHRSKDFALFADGYFATDNSIMTLAIAKAVMEGKTDRSDLDENAVKFMREIGQKYPNCGYGGRFYDWMFSESPAYLQRTELRICRGCVHAGGLCEAQ